MNSSHADEPRRKAPQQAFHFNAVGGWTGSAPCESEPADHSRFFLWRWFSRFIARGWTNRQLRQQHRDRAILAQAILGSSRSTLLSAFGPPRTAAIDNPPSDCASMTFLEATTWYYPLQHREQMAMAIRFSDDYADHVEFFGIALMSDR